MKPGIVGTGMVGSTAAYAIASTGGAFSIVLIDHNQKLAPAQAVDTADAVPFIGASGVEDTLLPAMTQAEMEALGASARMLKDTTDALGEAGTALCRSQSPFTRKNAWIAVENLRSRQLVEF